MPPGGYCENSGAGARPSGKKPRDPGFPTSEGWDNGESWAASVRVRQGLPSRSGQFAGRGEGPDFRARVGGNLRANRTEFLIHHRTSVAATGDRGLASVRRYCGTEVSRKVVRRMERTTGHVVTRD